MTRVTVIVSAGSDQPAPGAGTERRLVGNIEGEPSSYYPCPVFAC